MIDIRRVILTKAFRQPNDIPNKGKWNVFGHYDYLSITEIPWSSGHQNPITTIGNDADNVSTYLNGTVKTLVQYVFTYDSEQIIRDQFWDMENQYPLLLISLIHINNSKEPKYVLNSLSRIKKDHLDDPIGNVRCLPYMSMNCSDIVVFWLSSSFEEVMFNIYNICRDPSYYISDSFTIYAYQSSMNLGTISTNPLVARWKQSEPLLMNVHTYIRGHRFKELLELSEEICQALDPKKCNKYMLPGQEDILITIDELPVEKLISLYHEDGILNFSRMAKQRIISRTVIGFIEEEYNSSYLTIQKKKRNDKSNGKRTTIFAVDDKLNNNLLEDQDKIIQGQNQSNDLAVKLFYYFINSLPDREKEPEQFKEVVNMTWFSPLIELLNELCSTEINPTSHDIYIQELFCQYQLIKYIKELISRRPLPLEYSEDAVAIHRYLRGWSHLSFHAMHSEWQLTQTADVNRLYIFPAKLNLFYTAFMQYTTTLLRSYAETDGGSLGKHCAFFLTPTLGADPSFYPIYKSLEGNHILLVLGELPADLLYQPQFILPILVHEAAHYSGSQIRCREKRFETIWKSTYYNLAMIATKPWQDACDKAELIIPWEEIIISICEKSLPELPQTHSLSSPDIEDFISEKMLHNFKDNKDGIRNFESELVQAIFTRIKENSSDHIHDYWDLPIGQKLMCEPPQIVEHLNIEFDLLSSLYYECFADLCMLYFLRMDALTYLECLFNMHRIQNESHVLSMLRTREAYERILIMVNIAPLNIEPKYKGKSVLQQCKDSIEENNLRNPSQKSLLLMMVDGLIDLQDNTAIDDQGKPMQRIPFISQENLKDYLNECHSALSKKEINAFFNLYNVFTRFDRLGASNNDPIILYQRCNKMVASFTEKMIKFLTFELENTPTTRKLI